MSRRKRSLSSLSFDLMSHRRQESGEISSATTIRIISPSHSRPHSILKSTRRMPSPQEIDDIMALAIRVNDFLSGLFLGVGIRLVDFKMECGRLWEGEMMRIVVADEISPDSCRLWDIKSNDKLDKDRFRRDLGGLLEAYTEVAKRLGIMMENERPAGTGPVLVKG